MKHFFAQVYFQSGDFYNEPNSLWLDLVISVIGAGLGTFLGIWGAWKLYLTQVNRDREDTLKYTSSLIRSVIKRIRKQAEYCIAYSKQNIGNTTNVALLNSKHLQI